jgi:hypothetical protein
LIEQHRGRLIDSLGDNILAGLASVPDAVQRGVALQMRLKGKNAALPQDRWMLLPILSNTATAALLNWR